MGPRRRPAGRDPIQMPPSIPALLKGDLISRFVEAIAGQGTAGGHPRTTCSPRWTRWFAIERGGAGEAGAEPFAAH